jgi:hypothetical protein
MKKTIAILAAFVVALTLTANAQSLLTDPPQTSEQAAAVRVLAAPAQTRDVILGQLNDAFSQLWENPNPQGVLDAMGTKAGRLFQINAKFATVVGQLLAEEGDAAGMARFQAIIAKIPPHTVNPDGTVTINPAPEPEQ